MTDQIYIPFIPEVRKQLSAAEYEVFALCYALDERGKTIYFSNGYLSCLLNKTKRAIAAILEKIERKGFIKRILTETGRIIQIVKEKIKAKSTCKKLHGVRTKLHTTPVNKTASNNIVKDNIINEKRKEEKPPLSFVNKYFEELAKEYDMETNDISETFINKYLSGDEYKKNIGNWQGRARNFFKYWLKNEAKRGSEPRKLSKHELLFRKHKNASKVSVNGTNYDVHNAFVKFPSGDFSLYNLIRKWYNEGGFDLKIYE
jgi:DNA-binding MarR family transcriptional regulator/predicted HicB family RNase H-like nuclease